MAENTKGEHMRTLVIYHGGCRDGFCAAWVCYNAERARNRDADFFAAFYGQPPPDVSGRDAVIVDFSYPRDVMESMAREAASLVVLDHHKTAEEALRGFAEEIGEPGRVKVIFDMNRSGAGLAWDAFNPGKPRPWLVDYVEDRDLWLHRLPGGPAVNAYLGTVEFSFEAFDAAAAGDVGQAELAGRAVEAKIHQYIREVKKNAERITFEGYDVPIVNAPQVDISELVGHMANGETFAMGWWRGHGVFNYSLRSKGDFDVSELAKRYGGGGHKNAAGFQSNRLILEPA